MNKSQCPCGSQISYCECCEPIIKQNKVASSPEQLMRSRFTAFYYHNDTWLKSSWDSSTRPSNIHFETGLKWLDLAILNTTDIDANSGKVEFEARYLKNEKVQAIHENSYFMKHQKQWFYVNGDYLKTTFKAFKIKRNDTCHCGSGKKFKLCCMLES